MGGVYLMRTVERDQDSQVAARAEDTVIRIPCILGFDHLLLGALAGARDLRTSFMHISWRRSCIGHWASLAAWLSLEEARGMHR
jgi:hypothetical protein